MTPKNYRNDNWGRPYKTDPDYDLKIQIWRCQKGIRLLSTKLGEAIEKYERTGRAKYGYRVTVLSKTMSERTARLFELEEKLNKTVAYRESRSKMLAILDVIWRIEE